MLCYDCKMDIAWYCDVLSHYVCVVFLHDGKASSCFHDVAMSLEQAVSFLGVP